MGLFFNCLTEGFIDGCWVGLMLFLTWFGQPYRTVHFRVHYLSSASWTLQSSNRLVYQSLNQLVVSYDWTRVIFDTQILVSQTWGLGNLPIDWSMIPTILVPKCVMFCFNIQCLFPDEFICFSHFAEFKYAFHKYSSRRIDSLGVEYDYKSVMHYGAKAFSKNGLPTIVARQRSIKTFGNTNLSILDIQQVNLLYRCPGSYHHYFLRNALWK